MDSAPDMLLFWLLEFVIVSSLVFEVAVKLLAHGARVCAGSSIWLLKQLLFHTPLTGREFR